jgi:recombination protein RecR
MIGNLPSLEKLIHEFSKLPGVGPKSASRLAYYVLKSSTEFATDFSEAIRDVKTNISVCESCFSYTEEEATCRFCSDPKRTNEAICVVESPSDIASIESSGVFRGRYHVLHGVISPLDGVGPQDLKIAPLISKIKDSLKTESPIKEVILALDADLEGDTTVLYLAKILGEMGLQTSRIAHGVPIGGDIDYIDHRTLGRAIENRIQI